MERLTEKHSDSGDYYLKCARNCINECAEAFDCEKLYETIDRIGAIEDIIGDDYDLDRLSVMMNQCMSMRD